MLQWKYLRPRTNTYVSKIVIKSVVCLIKNEFLLFFVPNSHFWCILDCDDCNASCTWTTTGFFDVVPEYRIILCVCLGSCMRALQVKYYCCIKWSNLQNFFILEWCLCWCSVVFSLFWNRNDESKMQTHNIIIEIFWTYKPYI